MKPNWELKKLGDIVTIKGRIGYRGYTKQDIVPAGEGAITLSPSNITDNKLFFENCTYISWFKYEESPEIIINVGDIIYCKTASIGKVALVEHLPDKATINPQFVVLKNIRCLNKFLYYFLTSDAFKRQASNIISGTAIPTLSQTNLAELFIPFPPHPEQQRIVSILDKAFTAIDKAKANAAQNLKNAKELFESYLQSVFENKGNGWVEKTLGDVCEFRNGAAHEQHIDVNGKYILVNSKFISADGEKMKRTNSALAPLFVNDIAFVMSDVPKGKALAKCFLVDKNDTYTLNQRIGAINSKVFIPEFLIYQFNRNKYLLSFDNGENQTNLRKGDILECPLFVPSKEQQQTIVHQLDALRDEAQKLEVIYKKKIEDLEELKKSILQKAFNGELDTTKDIAV